MFGMTLNDKEETKEEPSIESGAEDLESKQPKSNKDASSNKDAASSKMSKLGIGIPKSLKDSN